MKAIHTVKSRAILVTFALLATFGTAIAAQKSNIDILVAYDQTATRWFADKDMSYATFASNQVDKINAVFENSGLGNELAFRLVGVHMGVFSYNDTPNIDQILNAVVYGNDGAWKSLKSDRDSAGADIVMILVDTGDSSGHVGTSVAMKPIVNGERQWGTAFAGADQYFASYYPEMAYGVCDITAVQNGYTMVHETGHIFGAGHSDQLNSAYSDPGPQLFSYSTAFMYMGSDGSYYSTIMGYNSTGWNDGIRYEVLPYFSSPNIVNPYTGEALGDADHDNVRTIRETYKLVEKFRASVIDGQEVQPPTPVKPTDPIVSPTSKPSTTIPAVVFNSKTVFDGVLNQGNATVGVIQLTVAKTQKGFSKFSGSVIGLDGKKKAIKGNKCKVFESDGVAFITVESAIVKGFDRPLNVTLGSDGSIIDGSIGDITIEAAEIGKISAQRLVFEINTSLASATGINIIESVVHEGHQYTTLPYVGNGEQITVTGDKWAVDAKVGKLKFKKGTLSADMGNDGSKTNLSGLKLSFTKKTGTFKGSFTAYSLVDAKLKKFKFDVTGLIVNGDASGIATCKKLDDPVTIPVSIHASK